MENVVYNEHGMLGYSVDAGVIPITERNQEGKNILKNLKLILCVILVHPDTIFSLYTYCQMKQSVLRKLDHLERLMILSRISL